MSAAALRKVASFLGVGLGGAAVDALVFFSLMAMTPIGFALGRVATSVVAITSTWALNRTLTFRNRRHSHAVGEYVRYFLASGLGGLANLAASYPVSLVDVRLRHVPAYVIGALAGLIVNFLLYDRLVFAGARKM